MKKRGKFILLPFLAFAIIDALVTNYTSTHGINILSRILYNLTGGFEGYFILIIFQFYILYYLVVRYKIPMEKFLFLSIIITMVHLYIFNNTDLLSPETKRIFKLFITSWLCYFAIGFLVGKYYDPIRKFLKEYKWVTLIVLGFAIYFIFLSFSNGDIAVNSKRIDIFILTVAVCMAVIAWGQVFPNLRIINLISNYSLGIYLLHWQVQKVIAPYIANLITSHSHMIIVIFFSSLIISMVLIKLISLTPFGKYIIGNTVRKYRKSDDQNKWLNPKTKIG